MNELNEPYFKVPRAFLDRAGEASPGAVSVYLHLCARLNTAGPSAAIRSAELARAAGLNQRTVFSAIGRLRELGLITSQKAADGPMNEYALVVAGGQPGEEESGTRHAVPANPDELQIPAAGLEATDNPPGTNPEDCNRAETAINGCIPLVPEEDSGVEGLHGGDIVPLCLEEVHSATAVETTESLSPPDAADLKSADAVINKSTTAVSGDYPVEEARDGGAAVCTGVEEAQSTAIVEPREDLLQIDAASHTTGNSPKAPAPSLDDLIAVVYSPSCHVGDLEPYVDLSEADLRSCLEWVRQQRGVEANMPIGFFARVLETAKKEISSPGPERQSLSEKAA